MFVSIEARFMLIIESELAGLLCYVKCIRFDNDVMFDPTE